MAEILIQGLTGVFRYDGRLSPGSAVVPGDRVGRVMTVPAVASDEKQRLARSSVSIGPGIYNRGGQLFAAVTGYLKVERGSKDLPSHDQTSSSAPAAEESVFVSVSQSRDFHAIKQVIRQGQTILSRVVRIAIQQVIVDIVANQNGNLNHIAEGCIRREDIHARLPQSSEASAKSATEVPLTDFFFPGDWIVARVISLGDDRRYFLSTAEPALGVLHAVSKQSGLPMVPVSWKEMECPESGAKEARKCARPQRIPLI